MKPFSRLAPGVYFVFRFTPRASFQIWVETESFELETITLCYYSKQSITWGLIIIIFTGISFTQKILLHQVSQKRFIKQSQC